MTEATRHAIVADLHGGTHLRDGLAKPAIWREVLPDPAVIEEVSVQREIWPIWTIRALKPR